MMARKILQFHVEGHGAVDVYMGQGSYDFTAKVALMNVIEEKDGIERKTVSTHTITDRDLETLERRVNNFIANAEIAETKIVTAIKRRGDYDFTVVGHKKIERLKNGLFRIDGTMHNFMMQNSGAEAKEVYAGKTLDELFPLFIDGPVYQDLVLSGEALEIAQKAETRIKEALYEVKKLVNDTIIELAEGDRT